MKRGRDLSALVLCVLGACAGTETGNPSFKGSLGYDAYSSAPRIVALTGASDSDAQSLRVDNAWLVLGDVELIGGASCAGRETLVHGLGAGDHAASQAPVTPFESNAGEYCGLRLPFVHAAQAVKGAPSGLSDESVLLSGGLPDGRSFELRSALELDVRLDATEHGFLLDGEHAGVVIGFDVATWLGELDWSQVASENERVLIDAEHNPELLSRFERALPHGVELFRDADGDGMLDADHVPIAIAPQD